MNNQPHTVLPVAIASAKLARMCCLPVMSGQQ